MTTIAFFDLPFCLDEACELVFNYVYQLNLKTRNLPHTSSPFFVLLRLFGQVNKAEEALGKTLRFALNEADENRAQLKDVYDELSRTAVYEERNRIAKDIHDNAGHSMTTVIMLTEAAKLLIDSDPQEAKSKMISANIHAKNALDQMRESVHLLAGRAAAKPLREDVMCHLVRLCILLSCVEFLVTYVG